MAADQPGSIFDVAVVGAGPAGSATARLLALKGWRVTLLERSRYEAPRVGESLAPNVQELLHELGVWSEFQSLPNLPSWGTVSLWGEAVPQSHSHISNPYGNGWHVDRQAFDQMLAQAAVEAGVDLFTGVNLRRSDYQDGTWHLQLAPDRTEILPAGRLQARVLIDATGRRAQVARSQGAERLLFDRLVGVAARFSGIDPEQSGFLLVEASPQGWWYSAPLPPNGKNNPEAMIVMLMTDADLCSQMRLNDLGVWHATLEQTGATRQRLKMSQPVSMPQAFCAHSQRLRHDHSRNRGAWLAVGDAALAVDPISGSGVLHALQSARQGAVTVHEMLSQPHASLTTAAAYEAGRDRECSRYLLERAQYYAVEQRFDTSFWKRRHVLQPA